MQAGLLTEIITFSENRSKRDEFGGVSNEWIKVLNKRAYVKFNSGARKDVNNEVFNTVVNTFTSRIDKVITPKMRIEYNGQKYKIISLNHDRKQQATIIIVELINE